MLGGERVTNDVLSLEVGVSSQNLISRGFSAAANDLLSGSFEIFVEGTPDATGIYLSPVFTLTSLEMTLVDAVPAPVPGPVPGAGLPSLAFLVLAGVWAKARGFLAPGAVHSRLRRPAGSGRMATPSGEHSSGGGIVRS